MLFFETLLYVPIFFFNYYFFYHLLTNDGSNAFKLTW